VDGQCLRADIHQTRAHWHSRRGRGNDAIVETRLALALREGLVQQPLENTPDLRGLSVVHASLGVYHAEQGQFPEARQAYERAVVFTIRNELPAPSAG
jgi:hypothetical protein